MKKNRTWKGILLVILLLSIGFAAVTTKLLLDGTFNFGTYHEDFDTKLVFTAAKLEYSDTNKTTKTHGENSVEFIKANGKKIEFTVDPLKVPGETATLTYEISNTSQYDAKLRNISCTVKDASNNDVTDNVLNATKGDDGKYKEYIKLETSSTQDAIIDAYNGVKGDNTIKVTMIKSYAGEAGVKPEETGMETKAYTVSCEITSDAVSANVPTATAGA